MSLKEYKRKRDFRKTPEPSGAAGGADGQLFVVQAHAASRMHYDFRLQVGEVLKSWAVPKGPSNVPGDKRLAVEVEDHPLDYAGFEGVIPQGEYGGGTVMVWDTGTWTSLDGDPSKGLRKGKLNFALAGERLKGEWTLTRMRQRDDEDKHNWLLIKRHGEGAGKARDPLKRFPGSVKTGRRMAEIASAGDAVWESNRSAQGKKAPAKTAKKTKTSKSPPKKPAATKARKAKAKPRAPTRRKQKTSPRRAAIDPSGLARAQARAMPRTLQPQLATLVTAAPTGPGWLHEIKFDGYRLLCRKDGDAVTLLTRAGKDWTDRFGPIAEAIRELPVDTAVVDGEATILDAQGRSSFQALQGAIKLQKFDRLAFHAFDLLYCAGYDLREAPLVDRKELLRTLVPAGDEGVLRYSDHLVGEGREFHSQACALGLEGVIAKQADSPYRGERSRSWLKIKCQRRQEFVIVGWTPPGGSRKHFGSLLLAAHDGAGRLIYTGRVGTGFTAQSLRSIAGLLKPLARRTSPTAVAPPRGDARGAHWVEPKLVGEVEFTEWTEDGRLRHPSFQGLREDKEATSVKIERPEPVETVESSGKPRTRRSKRRDPAQPARGAAGGRKRSAAAGAGDGADRVGGVTLSNPQRVLYPHQGLTKLDLANYYAAVAAEILPHVVNRPLSTVRCPQGRAQKCFFQKHVGETLGPPVFPIRVREKSGTADYIGIDSLAGLLTLVQFGVLEIHPWGARKDDVEKPDWLTFDLDPGEKVGFAAVVAGAERLRELLGGLDLQSFVKTSGGKGLHIVVPLTRRAGWDEAKGFAAGIAAQLAREEPERYVDNMSKAKRRGRIFVDYLRNGRGATSVAPYSTRAREGAPVSMPLAWGDLARLENAAQYTVTNTAAHLRKRRNDPWANFFRVRQQLTPARLRAVKPRAKK